MKKFTELDKAFARVINKQFEWMTRDRNGDLYIFTEKPHKTLYNEWDVDAGTSIRVWIEGALTIKPFESIKWKDKEPTLISDIYNPQAKIGGFDEEGG